MTGLKSKYRVDSVPWPIRPFYLLYSYSVGTVFYLYALLVHFTSRIEYSRDVAPFRSGTYIWCTWHQNVWLYFCVFPRHHKHVWINHPDWYMKPIHVMIAYNGVERLALGSTGNDGKKAAEEVTECLRQGYSTSMLPDGPYGPPKILRKGVLHMSAQSGVPILPVRYESSWGIHLPGWDRKILPLPFGKIRVRLGEPILPSREGVDAQVEPLRAALG